MAKRGYNLNNSFLRNIGEGRDVLFWEDLWVGDQCLKDKFPRLYHLEEVKDAKVSDRVSWINEERLFTWHWSRIPLGRNTDDIVALQECVAGQFQRETDINKLLPQSLGIFNWRVTRRRLPVRIELDKRGIDLHTVRCPLCDEDVESIDHAIVLCKYALEV
ncbi:uncharacterized protein [Rutidosis leptorrhynchoides]|uniref:uncharacterized protein n=1 Tax=Rutidosis leptorrhynchoides TaxID=125765 RepID=UPI003A99E146